MSQGIDGHVYPVKAAEWEYLRKYLRGLNLVTGWFRVERAVLAASELGFAASGAIVLDSSMLQSESGQSSSDRGSVDGSATSLYARH